MAYQRGSQKKLRRKEAETRVLRYRTTERDGRQLNIWSALFGAATVAQDREQVFCTDLDVPTFCCSSDATSQMGAMATW